MTNGDFNGTDPKAEIIENITETVNMTKRRMAEIKGQIDTMQPQVDKEQNRYTQIATELRNLRDNLDTTPREDIRDKYEEALDIRFRLATMRGQLEKFESNYELLQEKQQIMTQILSKLQGTQFLLDENESSRSRHGKLDVVGIIRAQEGERQHLARAMHDGPAQSLTNFILQAEICQRLFDRNPDRAAEELNNLKSNASKTFQKIRDFIFDLRPMMLDDLGVAPTVRRYIESFKEKHDIDAKLDISGDDKIRLENYREVLIFRAIQELMTSARDHAGPTKIMVSINMNTNPIQFSVQDDGRPIDASAVFDDEDAEMHSDQRVQAMRTTRSKIELVDGKMEVRSSEKDGTVVRVELPAE